MILILIGSTDLARYLNDLFNSSSSFCFLSSRYSNYILSMVSPVVLLILALVEYL